MGRRTNFFGILFLVCRIAVNVHADALDDWFVRNSGTTAILTAATYGDGEFVAVGVGRVLLTSTNGSNWVSHDPGRFMDLFCASYGDGVFVAGASLNATRTNVLVSTNALNWLGNRHATNASFYGASYAGGVHLLVGSDMTIMTATNIDFGCAGTFTNCNWTLRHYGGGQELRGAAYGNGVYVAVGNSVSMTSTDTITWASNSINGSLFDVTFGNEVFVAVGIGRILTSSDGLVWTNRNFGGFNWLTRVAFGNGTFVAVGEGGTILTSTDGVKWRKRMTPATALLTGVTYGNGTFVVTANDGNIYQSAPVSVPGLTATTDSTSGGIVLALVGEIGRGYRIQVSTNMAGTNWEDFLAFTNTAPTMEFLDMSVTNLSQRFYRAVSP